MQRWVVGLGTLLLGVLLLSLSVPRLAAHWLLLPGNAALERIKAGELLTPEGYARILRTREAALGWVELPQARIELGLTHYLMAQSPDETGVETEAALLRARAELERGLALEPADPRAWLWLADVNQVLGDRRQAAQAVRLSLLAAPRDPTLASARAGLALGLWDELPDDARTVAEGDARAALSGPPEVARAFVAEAVRRDRLGALREVVAGDGTLWAKLATLVEFTTPKEDTVQSLAAAAGASAALLASLSPANAMTVQEFLSVAASKEGAPTLARYFDGFGDALYDFNEVMRRVGVTAFCPSATSRPLPGAELQRRVEADLARKRQGEADFAAYARETTLGLVALEVLSAAHPCDDEGEPAAGGEADGAPPPRQLP